MCSIHRLFKINGDSFKNSLTVKRLRDLFDNYEADATKPEKETEAHRKEQDAFLEAVLNTNVMKKLMEFLVKKQ